MITGKTGYQYSHNVFHHCLRKNLKCSKQRSKDILEVSKNKEIHEFKFPIVHECGEGELLCLFRIVAQLI